jgi:hypothetical protein
MKKLNVSILGLVLVLTLCALPAPAKAVADKRISFKRGQTSAVVKGVLTKAGKGGDFIVRARKGQTLSLKLVARGDTIFILQSPTNENLAGEGGKGSAGFDLTETGDYHLSVANRDGRRTNFTLTVKVR